MRCRRAALFVLAALVLGVGGKLAVQRQGIQRTPRGGQVPLAGGDLALAGE